VVVCLEQCADLHMAQLSLLSVKSRLIYFLVLAHPCSLGKRAVKRVCVCVCVRACVRVCLLCFDCFSVYLVCINSIVVIIGTILHTAAIFLCSLFIYTIILYKKKAQK